MNQDKPHVAPTCANGQCVRDEACRVFEIVYNQLTAGIVDDHDRIMRATNEVAEAWRRLSGYKEPAT